MNNFCKGKNDLFYNAHSVTRLRSSVTTLRKTTTPLRTNAKNYSILEVKLK